MVKIGASATTPTISISLAAAAEAMRIRRPTASRSVDSLRANDSLTMATAGAPSWSFTVKSRPRRRAIPNMSKNPGETSSVKPAADGGAAPLTAVYVSVGIAPRDPRPAGKYSDKTADLTPGMAESSSSRRLKYGAASGPRSPGFRPRRVHTMSRPRNCVSFARRLDTCPRTEPRRPGAPSRARPARLVARFPSGPVSGRPLDRRAEHRPVPGRSFATPARHRRLDPSAARQRSRLQRRDHPASVRVGIQSSARTTAWM